MDGCHLNYIINLKIIIHGGHNLRFVQLAIELFICNAQLKFNHKLNSLQIMGASIKLVTKFLVVNLKSSCDCPFCDQKWIGLVASL
jgi:hypothetical protein